MYKAIKAIISNKTKYKIKSFLKRIIALIYNCNLTFLAKLFNKDKWGAHFYTQHYQNHFKLYKYKRNRILEIGVGGYNNPKVGGNSLRMWKYYFPFSKITSVDIFDKKALEEKRIKIYKGSQTDIKLLDVINKELGPFDIIIDDGSHINKHVIKTFEFLFPKLNKGRTYVVEDTQTSYWPDMGGEILATNNPNTIYGYFKGLIDGLNYKEFMIENYKPTYLDLNIMVFIFTII